MLGLLQYVPFLAEAAEEEDNSGLIKPDLGLSLWTLITFLIVLFILRKYAFNRIAGLLDERRNAIRQNIETAEATRAEADQVLQEYRQQLAAARQESSEILERARKSAEDQRRQLHDDLAAERERGIVQVQTAIQAETRQALDRIKREIADLAVLTTERVLGRVLDEAEQRRLIDDALKDVDFSSLEGGEPQRPQRA
jgi:F-type H+-transporting ATPase subunit b